MNKNRIDRAQVINAFTLGLTLVSLQVSLTSGGEVLGVHEFLEIMAIFIQLLHVLDVVS